MQMQRDTFNPNHIEQLGNGAGILPLARTSTGEFYVLLGRERFLPGWKGSCRWSGFEGSRKEKEAILTTAVREFSEESLEVLFPVPKEVERILTQKEYWTRVVLYVKNERRTERYHSTYVVKVPFNPDLPAVFSEKRSNMERLDLLSKEFLRLFPTFALSRSFKVELGDVRTQAGGVRITRHMVPIPEDVREDSCVGTREEFLTRCREAQEIESDSEQEEEILRWETEKREGGELLQTLHIPATHPYFSRLQAWEHVRVRLEKEAEREYSCVQTRWSSRFNRLQEFHVSVDHLEKDQIRWWSLTDLRLVMDHRGTLGNEVFRPYFLPVLQTVLHELAAHPPSTMP